MLKKYRKKNILSKKNKKYFLKNLKKIGYCVDGKNKLFLIKTIKSFQRHFRKELISGLLDEECFMIARNLSKKV